MLVGDLIDNVLRRLNEASTSSPVRWSRTEVRYHLEEALMEYVLVTGDGVVSADLEINPSSNIYPLPDDISMPMAVRDGDRYLLKYSVEDLDNMHDWESDTATSPRQTIWCPIGLSHLLIYPKANGSKTVTIEGLASYQIMAEGSQIPARNEMLTALEDFVVNRCMFKEGGAELAQSQSLYNRWIQAAQHLAGKNIIRAYPAWQVTPEAAVSRFALREAAMGERKP